MNYFEFVNERIKKLKWQDISILKTCVLAFALMLAKLWPPILSLNWRIYGIIFIITYVYLIYRFYFKK